MGLIIGDPNFSLLPHGIPGREVMLLELEEQDMLVELEEPRWDKTILPYQKWEEACLQPGFYAIEFNHDILDFVSLSGPAPCPDPDSALRLAVANLGGVYQEAEGQP